MASARSSDSDDGTVTVLTFTLEDERYCVRADAVASVFGVDDGQSIATAADPWNAGTVTVGANTIRVVDLPRAFNSTARTSERLAEPKLLVFASTDTDGTHYGWLVDDVDVTRTVRRSDLEATRTSAVLSHIEGRFEIDGEEVVFLDERTIHD